MNAPYFQTDFSEHGFAIADHCLSPEYCDHLCQLFDSSIYGLRELLTIDGIQNLAASEHIRSLAEAILEKPSFAVSGTLFNKTATANWKVPWHQDRMIKVKKQVETAGWGPWSPKSGVMHVQPPSEVMSRVVAIRLHLDDCPDDNGALRVIPGSHRHGFLSPQQCMEACANITDFSCAVSRGDALIMSPLLLHTSSPSRSPSFRRVIHLEFACDDLPAPLEWLYRVA